MSSAPIIDYNQLEHERANIVAQEFEQRLARRVKGGSSGFRYMVMHFVMSKKYDEAYKEIEGYVSEKKDFPIFNTRTAPYVRHCKDLISAIRNKREFPALGALPVSKQKELFDKVIEHFDELKSVLRRIEAIGYKVQLDDIRSTTIFLKSFVYSLFAVIAVIFLLDLQDLLVTYGLVMGNLASSLTDMLFSF
ncbi:MAG: hypothetical protein MK008_14460 [Bdellovibrionales bacterium]|nr:hypothetical protein [Bdellovibrionales bacterium]